MPRQRGARIRATCSCRRSCRAANAIARKVERAPTAPSAIAIMIVARNAASTARIPPFRACSTGNEEAPMARKIRPPAELTPRDGDEELGIEQIKQIALFKDINLERLELEGFPGTVVLRRFRKGE